MKQLKFQGYSDDTFACTGPDIDVDHDNCASGEPIWMRVKSAEGSLIVGGYFAPGPCGGWMIGISNDDPTYDDVPIPEWPIVTTRSDRGYSPVLRMIVPDDTIVELIKDDDRR